MKRVNDPRHQNRISTVKNLFSLSFADSYNQPTELALQIMENKDKIDNLIKKNAPIWPLEQISPVDLAVLRLAIFELIFQKKKEPYKVIVDEAVEIAKEFGTDSSGAFINGVLGSVIKSQKIN